MKLAVCAAHNAAMHEPFLLRDDFFECLKQCKDLGYDGMEMHFCNAADIDAAKLKSVCEQTGVGIACMGTGLAARVDKLFIVDDDIERRKQAIERVKGHLDLAEPFACSVIIGTVRSNVPSPDMKSEYYARLQSSLNELGDYLEGKNATLVVEAINRYENNYLNNAEETLEFLEKIKSPRVRLLLDTFHMNIEEVDMAAAIKMAGQRLGHFHLGDNTRRYPGTGTVDFAKVIAALKQIDYKGWVSLECLPYPDGMTAARKTVEYIRPMIAKSI